MGYNKCDPLVQLEQLRQLPAGWLDGEGQPPGSELLSLVGQWLEEHQRDDDEPPRLYPTAEGGVEAEWRIGRLDLSIEFDPSSGMAEWHALDLDSGVADERQASLRDASGLKALGVKLQHLLAEGGTKISAASEGGPASFAFRIGSVYTTTIESYCADDNAYWPKEIEKIALACPIDACKPLY